MIENAAREGASARTLNEPLRWAYQLLQRTQRGYQPSQAELERYEAVITRQLGGGGAAGAESASAR